MEIDYGYHRCTNCGRQAFMWGWKIDNDTFLCDLCVKSMDQMIEDRKHEAEHKTNDRLRLK